MRSTFKVLFFIRKDRPQADGTMPLSCRITLDCEEVRFGMKVNVDPAIWDARNGMAIGRNEQAAKINALIDNTRSSLTQLYRDLQDKDHRVSAEKIKNAFLGITYKQHKLLDLFTRHNEEVKSLIDKTLTKATYAYCILRDRIGTGLHKYSQYGKVTSAYTIKCVPN